MKKSVIIVAYACSPEGSSEQLLGWKWVERAAGRGQVILITRPDRPGLRDACEKSNIRLIEVPVPGIIRVGTQPLGNFGMWQRVAAWSKKVNRVSRMIDRSEKVVYGHLVTFHSAQMPPVFDGCSFTKVWGPVSGMERIPRSYLKCLGPDRFKEALRNFFLAAKTKAIRANARKYDVVLYGNSETMSKIEPFRKGVNRLVMPNGLQDNQDQRASRVWEKGTPLRLLFVGSCQAQRAIALVLHALAKIPNHKWTLDVAGTGSGLNMWQDLAGELGISEKVRFHGWVGRKTVDSLYRDAHLFVFPSLRDGGGSGMLEAIERGLPVVALDCGGPADVIGGGSGGCLLPVSSPDETVKAIRKWFEDLFSGVISYSDLVKGVERFDRHRFSWDFKMHALDSALRECESSRLSE